ncbi:MAG: DUF2752 domain-containing protein [Phycisphaerales bacterium]|nr:DUF2752 domain-containing protein [Phycisphaerales bacterium]
MEPTAITAVQPHRAGVQLPLKNRCVLGTCALGALALLLVAAWLEPSSALLGTHTQLGIPPCTWPTTLGIPCPSCGMTTAFALAADGRCVESLNAQPLGFILALCAAGFAVVAGFAAATGSPIVGALTQQWGAKCWWALGAAILLSWGYKMLATQGAFS